MNQCGSSRNEKIYVGIQPPVAKRNRSNRFRYGGVAAVALILLLMLYPGAVIEAMRRGLQRCAITVIPSIFPFLVASELLVQSGVGERLPKALLAPFRRLFGLSRGGAISLIMGVVCGFPVGMRTAASYVRQGEISHAEQERLLCFANVPSAAFLTNAVGRSLYGSAIFGRILLLLSLLSAMIVGVLFRVLFDRNPRYKRRVETEAPACKPVLWTHRYGMLGEAMSTAATGMLNVVATVLFFGAVLGALTSIPVFQSDAGLLPVFRVGVVSLFEITGGVCEAAQLWTAAGAALPFVLGAGCVGWAGFSVHFQLLAACEGVPTHVGRFFLARALQAGICMVGTWLLILLGVISPCAAAPNDRSVALLWGDGADGVWLLWAILNLCVLLCATVFLFVPQRNKEEKRR